MCSASGGRSRSSGINVLVFVNISWIQIVLLLLVISIVISNYIFRWIMRAVLLLVMVVGPAVTSRWC